MPFQPLGFWWKRAGIHILCFLVMACGNGIQRTSAGGGIVHALPGATPFSEELVKKLEQAWAQRDPQYKPRTHHLDEDGSPKYINRLFLQSSPYLLQHAHNPVNWYPWGDEAFRVARELGRSVLLSVGYSTCHWCHVMEEESFEDEEIARFLNEHYVAIKVDREERPDVDAIYMAVVQATTGRGGWPMTVWLTRDRKPFYAGTYFPARDGDRGVGVGFLTLLRELHKDFESQPEQVAERSTRIAEAIGKLLVPRAGDGLPQAKTLSAAISYYKARFDFSHGGLKGAPKFPSSLPVGLLLRYHRRTGHRQALEMATLTLEKMAQGGMYDHVGGGFHRYSTDAQWLVPHFEKMLYDNALLVVSYLEAYQATGRNEFARVAREILRYVERDMTSPEGVFYSATDADSLGPSGKREEGYFFTWMPAEVEAVLGKERARLINEYFVVTPEGNFEGRNILSTPKSIAQVARGLKLPTRKARSIIHESREELYAARKDRPNPLRDEKILTAWNALMISAHAQAALVLGDERYASRARRAAEFVLRNLREKGRLLRSYKDGIARYSAYLDDYAFLTAAFLDLYETTSDARWLQEVIELDKVLERHHEDRENGGFFMTADDHEQLLAREKPSYDGAKPSGNSLAVKNLLRLYEFTSCDRYRQRAERAFKAFDNILNNSPVALSEMLTAVDFYLDLPKEIVIVTPRSRKEAEPFLARLRHTFLPNRILAVVPEAGAFPAHEKLIPLLKNKVARKSAATAYVCEKGVCELPTTDPDVFAKQIQKVKPLAGPRQP